MKTNIILLLCLISISYTFSQNYEPGKLWVSVSSDEARATEKGVSRNTELNNIFTSFDVSSYKQIMGFAKTQSLRDIYEITCQCDELELKDTLEQQTSGLFSFIEQVQTPVPAYEPEDTIWKYNQNWIWHLPKIQADSAWDITIGNPQIKIGIIDHCIDIEHPDLATQTYPHFDPLTGYEFNSLELFRYNKWHGTTVASFAAAKTAETGTNPNPNGNLASIGFKTKIVGYEYMGMARVLHASTVMGTDVINCSWMYFGNPTTNQDSTYQKIISEVINNGTVIVSTAGNGFCVTWYNDTEYWANCDSIPPDFEYFSAPYPFNPKYDSSIIIITTTDSLDNHTLYGDSVVNRTHSHFPEVDICSPGHNIMGATLTYYYDPISGDTLKKTWPYYGAYSGTSFAAPIVSGVCALLKSINPCLTPAQIEEIIKLTADPVADENQYNGLLGAGRINAYHAVKYAQENYGYEEFTIRNGQDTTWITDIQAKKIRIENGGKLTIKSTVYMLPESDIIVEKGGELVIDSGYITTCKGLWNGIQVRGRVDLDQYTYTNQGHLKLLHGATIQNAKTGVQLAKLDSAGLDPYSSGGIIHAVDANFINCVNSIAFYPYENFLYDKKNIKDNLSYLNYCTFSLDTNYNHVFESPKHFIYMESVRGISIKGCTFINEIKSKDYDDVTEIEPDNMVGLMSLNSSFYVDEYCLTPVIPCDSSKGCRFENLNYGIYAMNFGSEKYPLINKSEFISNKTGVYLGAINNAVVISNYFYTEPVDTAGLNPFILGGLYLDHCNAYKVEENNFSGNSSPWALPYPQIGLVVNNSGPYANEVYKNDFANLEYGVIAMNQNKRDSVGLCIKCNDFDHCDYDISVVLDSAIRGWGIAENQGSRDSIPSAPAGNIFTSNYNNHEFDLYNDDNADPFTYYHHREVYLMTPNLEPDLYSPSVSPVLNPQEYDPDRSCPSNLGGGGGSLLEKSIMHETELQITSIEGTLQSLVDGGNTESLTEDVTTSTPPEALDLTGQLLIESPYLSDTVIKSAIEKEDVLNNALLRDILVENPQSAKSEDILQMIDEREDPMPDYMKDQIEQGKFTTGDKENLEANRSFYLLNQTRACNNLNRIYQSDPTIINRLDSLVNLFEELNSLENQYRKAFVYLENGDTNQLSNLLSSIPINHSLTTEQSDTHLKYEALLNIMSNLAGGHGSAMALDSTQIAGLLDIYDHETVPGIYARNILVISGYLTYHEPYLFPNNLKRMEITPGSEQPDNQEAAKLKVFPNPTAYYTIVEFEINENEFSKIGNTQVIINVTDLRGNLLKNLKSCQNSDQLVLDVRDLKSGLYLIDLNINGQRIKSVKFIVNR